MVMWQPGMCCGGYLEESTRLESYSKRHERVLDDGTHIS